ncbi:hypothetical protein TgHK011_001159 [Trichoderma gracile]|nr:hypothetical protein TgHK011_001159 [Trichoderma gracile]
MNPLARLSQFFSHRNQVRPPSRHEAEQPSSHPSTIHAVLGLVTQDTTDHTRPRTTQRGFAHRLIEFEAYKACV